MITEIDLEIRSDEYELITYKEFINLLNEKYDYIHIVNKKNFLYIKVRNSFSSLSEGISVKGIIKSKTVYSYEYYKVENK